MKLPLQAFITRGAGELCVAGEAPELHCAQLHAAVTASFAALSTWFGGSDHRLQGAGWAGQLALLMSLWALRVAGVAALALGFQAWRWWSARVGFRTQPVRFTTPVIPSAQGDPDNRPSIAAEAAS